MPSYRNQPSKCCCTHIRTHSHIKFSVKEILNAELLPTPFESRLFICTQTVYMLASRPWHDFQLYSIGLHFQINHHMATAQSFVTATIWMKQGNIWPQMSKFCKVILALRRQTGDSRNIMPLTVTHCSFWESVLTLSQEGSSWAVEDLQVGLWLGLFLTNLCVC